MSISHVFMQDSDQADVFIAGFFLQEEDNHYFTTIIRNVIIRILQEKKMSQAYLDLSICVPFSSLSKALKSDTSSALHFVGF